jgi:hypothetical protein
MKACSCHSIGIGDALPQGLSAKSHTLLPAAVPIPSQGYHTRTKGPLTITKGLITIYLSLILEDCFPTLKHLHFYSRKSIIKWQLSAIL